MMYSSTSHLSFLFRFVCFLRSFAAHLSIIIPEQQFFFCSSHDKYKFVYRVINLSTAFLIHKRNRIPNIEFNC